MTYRDATTSHRAYRDRIAAELEEARRCSAKLEGLEIELSEAEALLETADRKSRLPLFDGLDDIRIASPCRARWDDMVGDGRVRHCAACDRDVYDLSAMRRDEGEALLRNREGRICVRMHRRADGTVLTADCPVGLRRKRTRHGALMALVAAGSGVIAAMALDRGPAAMDSPASATSGSIARPRRPAPTMGVVLLESRPRPTAPSEAPARQGDAVGGLR